MIQCKVNTDFHHFDSYTGMLLATGAWLNLHTPSQWILSVIVPVQSSVKYSQIYSQLRSEAVKTTRLIMVKKWLSKKWQAASGLKCFTSEISAPFAFCTISEKCVNKNSFSFVFFLRILKCPNLSSGYCF